MVTLYFDVSVGDLTIQVGNDKLIVPLLRTVDGNFHNTLSANAHELIIKKLVAAMTLK